MSEQTDSPENSENAVSSSSTAVDLVHAVEAAHPTVFDANTEGPMLPGQVHTHATPFQYVVIAAVLCAITAVEIFLYYQEGIWEDRWITASLFPLSFVKFLVVAGYYMHLKSDLKIYRRYFIVGGVGAGILFYIALASLGGRLNAGAFLGLAGMLLVAIAVVAFGVIRRGARRVA